MGSELMPKKEFLKTSLVQKKVILLKYGDKTHGQEELSWDCEERLTIYLAVGEIKIKGTWGSNS